MRKGMKGVFDSIPPSEGTKIYMWHWSSWL